MNAFYHLYILDSNRNDIYDSKYYQWLNPNKYYLHPAKSGILVVLSQTILCLTKFIEKIINIYDTK
jgi:hypothetical protein